MRRAPRIVVVATLVALCSFAVPTAAWAAPPQPTYTTYTTYDVAGAQYTGLTGITNRGVLAGYYGDESGRHGFIDDGRELVTVDVPGSTTTAVTSINDARTVTGTYWSPDGTTQRGFLRDARGGFTWLDSPAATGGVSRGTVPTDLTNGGTVVGYTFVTDDAGLTVSHGFVWKHGRFTAFDAPGATTSAPVHSGTQLLGVDNAGNMVGSMTFPADPPDADPPTNSPNRGFLAERHAFTPIIDPAVPLGYCGDTRPNAINERGTIAGNSANDCAPVYRAWVFTGGVFFPLEYPGATATTAEGINDRGVVVGTWRVDTATGDEYVFGPEHGYLATTR
jgi:hypothetical protein